MAEELKRLVLCGKKTATAGLYEEGQRLPRAGEHARILDTNKNPFCVIQYIAIDVKNLLDVEFSFAKKEGEGDKNIHEWREKFKDFFGLERDDVKVVCEEFKLVELV